MMGDMAEFCELKAAEFEDWSWYDDGTGEMSTDEKLAMALERNAELENDNRFLREQERARMHALLFRLGGTDYEGHATGCINYLQRIDILRQREAEAARYRAALEEIEAGMWIEQGSRDEMFQSIQMAAAIAHRALRPEEE